MKKIVIIDDEYFFRQALIKYVRSFKDEFTVVGDAGNGKLGIELIEQYHPEIILIVNNRLRRRSAVAIVRCTGSSHYHTNSKS